MARELTIGIAQITASGPDSLPGSLDAAGELFAGGANLVVLPELIVPGYRLDPEFLQAGAEPLDGPATQSWTQLAATHRGYLAAGFCERDGERLFNTAVLVGSEGVVLHYRKLHRFAGEKEIFAPGDLGLPVADTPLGKLGLCICYDLRFVETARILALSGAELICVPTAWLAGFDQQRWDRDGFCPQARGAVLQSNLDQVFIACASQAGNDGNAFLGSSVVSDPYGAVKLGPLPGEEAELALVTVDLDEVKRAHDRGASINPQTDRRSDVYGLTLEGTVL
ncbi:MAG TPA: nitrilase-related carbon-nitrogen hydrolase [Solirubrobacteraceae bacterium]|jgi:predicted amidohydrolase